MSQKLCLLPSALIAAMLLPGNLLAGDADAKEAEVTDFVRSYMDAFNEQKLETISQMWAEDAAYVDLATGETTNGRAAIVSDIAIVFDAPVKTRLSGEIESIRFATPEVATVRGSVTTLVPDEDPENSQFSAVVVKEGGKWRIDSVSESSVVPPVSSREALQELAWFVGDWLDESTEARVVSAVRWSENEAFLVRTIAAQNADESLARVGTQIVGWDPRMKQIRSWTFNADGSFGDGIWSQSGDDWLVKSSQTLAGGEAASGTYIITPIDDETLTMRLVGHEIEGQPMPTPEAVTIVRLPHAENQPNGDEVSNTPATQSPAN